ncbi:IPTL-CTERM sorting domain-containing protein [Brevundimonas sp.]|uniref:IPTL-CTERM sorting domain-containing protein n=1 Tax=unclassified Brevundimonas TaxID=2622653 RepID=UPI00391800CF
MASAHGRRPRSPLAEDMRQGDLSPKLIPANWGAHFARPERSVLVRRRAALGLGWKSTGRRPHLCRKRMIDTSTRTVVGAPIPVGSRPSSIALAYTPPSLPATVPTLSEWAMILLGLMLAGGAAIMVQQRRTA